MRAGFGTFCAALCSVALLASCEQKTSTPVTPGQAASPEKVTKLVLKADGTILVDGEACDLEKLGAILDGIKASGGAMSYERENRDSEPHENARKAIGMIINRQIPIGMPGGHGHSTSSMPAGHPPMQGSSGMPAGHPPMQGGSGMPAGHPPMQGNSGMPTGHPAMPGMPAGHPPMTTSPSATPNAAPAAPAEAEKVQE